MTEPPNELKPNNDEPDDVQSNAVEPDIEQPNFVVNTASYFFKCEKYKVRDDMIEWCKKEALKAEFTMVITKSDNGSFRRKKFFLLGCSRGGAYKETYRKLKKEDTATRTFKCPFRLRGYFLASEKWSLSVVCGEHNHQLSKNLEGHTLAGRLKPEEKECVHELSRNLVAPKNILSTLKGRNPESKTSMKAIYNARQRFNKDHRGEMSEMQQLMKCCESHKYFHKCRTVGDSTTIQDFFWAHLESVKLFNTFPTVLMLDSTYKTNKYKMPLFEIIGVTSTEESYNVGFAYIANEQEDDFTWALETCLSLLKSKDTVPKVIVTDRDQALMNAVAKVFLNSTALLCRFHVFKNVRSKFKALCTAKEQKMDHLLNTLTYQWGSVVESTSEESYIDAVVEFRKVFDQYPIFLKYVETTILDPVKEKIVRVWTDSVMHIGNTTTNRVESQHGVLKQYLPDCKGDLVKGWEATNQMVSNQLTKIKTSFGQSTTAVEHYFKDHFLYTKLVYNISRQALHFIRGEEIRSRECGRNRKNCGCVIKRTYGLPCACLIALKLDKKLPIRLDEINTHWKRLQIDEADDGEVDCLKEWNVIQERLKLSDHAMKLQIREQLRHIAHPEITSLTAPLKPLDTKGAKKWGKSSKCNSSTTRSPSLWEHIDARYPDSQASQSKPYKPRRKAARIGTLSPNAIPRRSIPFIEYMPPFMHSYIEEIIDVKGDGHCGFRVAAEYLNKGEESQGLVRYKLIRELTMYRKEYLNIYGTEERLQCIHDGLYPPKVMPKSGIAPKKHWFSFPDMGHILATAYNRVVVELTKHEIGYSETFFPLRGRPPLDPSARIMCLGMIPNYFVYVKLKAGCPLPPTSKEWKIYRAPEVETWEDTFLDRMTEFEELMNNEKGEMETNEDDPIIVPD